MKEKERTKETESNMDSEYEKAIAPRKKVFLCMPHGHGCLPIARLISDVLFDGGDVLPLTPLFYHEQLVDMDEPEGRKKDIELSLALLACADEVYVGGPGITAAMEIEILAAIDQQIPVRYFAGLDPVHFSEFRNLGHIDYELDRILRVFDGGEINEGKDKDDKEKN